MLFASTSRRFTRWAFAALFAVTLSASLTGCGSGPGNGGSGGGITYTPPPGNFDGLPFTGKVMAGSVPLAGSSVQLYAAGTSGNGSAPTQLLSNGITTGSDGSFAVAQSYTCPTAASILYVVARGGSITSGQDNANITLLSTLGRCQNIGNNPSFVVNELTTVASVYALAQFLGANAQLGATATNTTGITNAAATAASLVDLHHGTSPGATFPTTGVLPSARLNTLGNLLNACVATGGASCTALFTATAISGDTPTNTLDAVMNIAKNPAQNVAAIYTASSASSAYAAALNATPSDWTMFATYKGGGLNQPTALGIDSKGNVWAASYNNAASLFSNLGVPAFGNNQGITGLGLYQSYGLAIDANDDAWITNEASTANYGSVTVLTTSGAPVSGNSGYTQGGLFYPVSIAIDNAGTAWIANNAESTVVHLSNSGTSLAGSSGVASPLIGVAISVAVDSKNNAYVANDAYDSVAKIPSDGSAITSVSCCDRPAALAVDQSNNVWVTNSGNNTVAQINANGQVVSPGYDGGGLHSPLGLAIDGAGNVWVSNYLGNTITELAGANATTPGTLTPGTVLSGTNGYGNDATLGGMYGIAIDASGNVWISNENQNALTELFGIATPVKTPLVGGVATP